MQPSEIHLRNELAALRDELKTATNKSGIKARIKEIEQLLNPKNVIEKATIASDEQIDETSI